MYRTPICLASRRSRIASQPPTLTVSGKPAERDVDKAQQLVDSGAFSLKFGLDTYDAVLFLANTQDLGHLPFGLVHLAFPCLGPNQSAENDSASSDTTGDFGQNTSRAQFELATWDITAPRCTDTRFSTSGGRSGLIRCSGLDFMEPSACTAEVIFG